MKQVLKKILEYQIQLLFIFSSFLLLSLGYLDLQDTPQLKIDYDNLLKQRSVSDFNVNNSFEIEKNISEIKALDAEIRSRMLKPTDRTENFRYLFALEADTGVKIENPRQVQEVPFPDENAKDSEVVITHFKIDATGSYSQILKFIYQLQVGKFLGRITDLTISNSKLIDPSILNVSLEIAFFGFPS